MVVLALSAALSANRALAQTGKLCFAEVPDCIEGRFAEYWQQNGGLPVFGFPIGPASEQETSGGRFLTQQFERNRFELHPENARPYDVLLGRLGDDRLRQLGRPWESQPKAPVTSKPGCVYFEQTQHLVCDQFLAYWHSHGLNLDGRQGFTEAESLALFGLPLTEASVETDSQGNSYLTQWYERARFELHPEVGPDVVLLGLLGRETSASTPQPQPTPAPAQPVAACDGVPPSIDAEVAPSCVFAGDIFEVTAHGFKPSERVFFYVTSPDQVIGDFPVTYADPSPDRSGLYHARGALSLSSQPGIYALTLEGDKSDKKAVAFIKIVARPAGGSVPVDHSLLPPSQNGNASPETGRQDITAFKFTAHGFTPHSAVNLSITRSDGQVLVAEKIRNTDKNGDVNDVYYKTDRLDPLG
ncbi:MAG TPA: hypothetical protein VFO07_17945, partial [Roseiflexaceae bacterium]|nr:hypothetical protein [Roseiflexaceae bacterium]